VRERTVPEIRSKVEDFVSLVNLGIALPIGSMMFQKEYLSNCYLHFEQLLPKCKEVSRVANVSYFNPVSNL
jgi:hypothetical protein